MDKHTDNNNNNYFLDWDDTPAEELILNQPPIAKDEWILLDVQEGWQLIEDNSSSYEWKTASEIDPMSNDETLERTLTSKYEALAKGSDFTDTAETKRKKKLTKTKNERRGNNNLHTVKKEEKTMKHVSVQCKVNMHSAIRKKRTCEIGIQCNLFAEVNKAMENKQS